MVKDKFVIISAVAGLLCWASVNAQGATVSGQITDSNKKPLAQAMVTVGDKFDFTDVDGKYRIKDVPEGRQKMLIKKESEVLKEADVEIKEPVIQKDEIVGK